MDFDFSQEQQMLQQMTRELLATESAAPQVRVLADSEDGWDRNTWSKLAELGLIGISIPEEHGGQGLGQIEQALVLEEMGRAALPSPYFATAVLATTALLAGGSEALKQRCLPEIAAGRLTATLAWIEERLSWSPEDVRLSARPEGDGWLLDGTKWVVPWAHAAGIILVAARTPEGVSLFVLERDTPGLQMKPLSTFDPTNRVSRLDFDGVRVEREHLVGRLGGGAQILDEVLLQAALGASAEMLGASRKCLEMAVEYAKTREQFGQPIGMFQAIKHKCADRLVDLEESHSATYYAAWALSATAAGAELATSVAKAFVSDASRRVCSDAIQVHGGIGFTWDYDLHLYFKRAKHLEPLYGDADFHRERALGLALAESSEAPA
ncbi:MAG TPA: acyl-CoA dehydrogenase family protein [Chloroflexota bacterium]|nr:acyl-CoA dehydrogenase family protein [Chloroflexota bacterium]